MNRARIELACGCLLAASIALATVHPWGNPRSGFEPGAPTLQGSNAPEDVRRVLEKKCGDCHSTTIRYPAYSRLAPVSWMVEREVHEGRGAFDMSRWQDYTADQQISLLIRIGSESRSGEMPLKPYLRLHPGNRLTTREQELIYDWTRAERKRMRRQLSGSPDKSALQSRIEKR
jgi:cytochrome c